MPPKNKGGKKKKKKKTAEGAEGKPTQAEENMLLTVQVESLKHQLIMQENRATSYEGAVRDLRQRLVKLHQDYKDEKEKTLSLATDMTRQYKDMKQTMKKQVEALEKQMREKEDQLHQKDALLADTKRKHDQEVKRKDAEIEQAKTKMDAMADSFSNMLKQTLDQMSQKIVMTNEWDAEAQNGPIVRSYDDLNMGLSKTS